MIWLTQILTILFAVAFAWQQSSAVKSFRDYVPVNNPYMKKYHRRGWFVSALFVIGVSVLLGLYLYTVVNALWYWIAFDCALNKFTGKPLDYVGNTAWIDRQLRRFKISGGDKIVFLCFVILVLNIILHGKYIA